VQNCVQEFGLEMQTSELGKTTFTILVAFARKEVQNCVPELGSETQASELFKTSFTILVRGSSAMHLQ